MTRLEQLQDLERRLSEAEGADTELDVAVLELCGKKVEYFDIPYSAGKRPGVEISGSRGAYSTDARSVSPTASLDASLRLVGEMLPGWKWERTHDSGHMFFRVVSPDFYRYDWMGSRNSEPSSGWCYHEHDALALLLALVRALKEKADE